MPTVWSPVEVTALETLDESRQTLTIATG